MDNYDPNSSVGLYKTYDHNSQFEDAEYLTIEYLEHIKENEKLIKEMFENHLLKLKKSVNTLNMIDSFRLEYEKDIEFCIKVFDEQNLKSDDSQLQLALRNLRKIRLDYGLIESKKNFKRLLSVLKFQ